MEQNLTARKKDYSYSIFFGIIVVAVILATGLNIKFVSVDGLYHSSTDQNAVVTYDEIGPDTMYTVDTIGQRVIKHVSSYVYVPSEGQIVHLFQVRLQTVKNLKYFGWVVPKVIVITKTSGKFGLVADDSGRTNNLGYVRNSLNHRYTIPVDNKTPHYRSFSFGVLPEIGDTIRFWYLEIFFSREKFFNLAILY